MRFGWARRRSRTVAEHPVDSARSATATQDRAVAVREQAEAAAQQIADRWNALTAEEQADIEAAVAEQRRFMDEHGITSFHGCARGRDDSEPSALDAATVRAQTTLLRTVVGSNPPF